MQLKITHLYPDQMNLYGDQGNIIVLQKRAEARGIEVIVKEVGINQKLASKQTDLYFFGGGQDSQQIQIAKDLLDKKKQPLLQDLRANVPILAICGGYQLLGKYYLSSNGKKAKGIGFFPIETVAPGAEVKQRCIGNITTKIIHENTLEQIRKFYKFDTKKKNLETLVGFENHSGRTRLLNSKPSYIGKVKRGVGDSENKGFEGLRYKNAFGSYMHGSFLPKNPHFADLLINLALKNKYGKKFGELETLDDTLEWQTHEKALKLK